MGNVDDAPADEPTRRSRALTHWLVVSLLIVVIVGYVYLGWQSQQVAGDLSSQLERWGQKITTEVTAERERRLDELHTIVKSEQRRQDAVTAEIAVQADKRATVAENKAEIAKTKTAAVEKRTAAVERKQKRVEKVLAPAFPAIVEKEAKPLPTFAPTPVQSTPPTPKPYEQRGLFNMLFGK